MAGSKARDNDGGDGGSSTAAGITPLYILAWLLGGAGVYFSFFDPDMSPAVQAHVWDPPAVYASGTMRLSWLFVFAGVGVCCATDVLFARWFVGRYFALHVVMNTIIILMSFRDTLNFWSAANPYDTNTCVTGAAPCNNNAAVAFTFAVHIFHAMSYSLKPIDWIHHLPSFAACLVGLYFPFGPVLNFTLLCTLMGVPGCIDYALLVCVKQGWLAPAVEKRWNQTLNVWIRCPFAVVSGYVMVMGPLLIPAHYTGVPHRFWQLVIGLHNVWNGCFFMYRTVDARTRHTLVQRYPQLKEAMLKEKASKKQS